MTTPFILHSVPGSPYGRAVLAALEEKHAPYRLAALKPGTANSPGHLARNPFGRIPVLEHGDFTLYETQAILRYIDRAIPETPLTPSDIQAAGRMDQAMNVNDWYLFQGVANVIAFQRVVGPVLRGITPDEALIAAAMPKAHTVFAALSQMLGDQPFFAGDHLSLADLLIAPQLDFLSATPEWAPLTEARPNLTAWLARMNARPSLQVTTWERVSAMATA